MVQTRSMIKAERDALHQRHIPYEIQVMIFKKVIAISETGLNAAQASPGIGYLASVCRHWRDIIEPIVFERLVLDQSSLPFFREAIGNRPIRLNYIHYLCLRLKLSEYTLEDHQGSEDQETTDCNNQIFSKSLVSLFGTLSSWQPLPNYSTDREGGLTLELLAASPSDSQYHFFFHEDDDHYPFRSKSDLRKVPNLQEYYKLRTSQEKPFSRPCRTCNQRQLRLGKTGILDRVFGNRNPLRLVPPGIVLLETPIIESLLIRRQNRRGFDTISLATVFKQALVSLKCFRYEMRVPSIHAHELMDGLAKHLIPSLPCCIERLYLNHWVENGSLRAFGPSLKISRSLATCNRFRHLTHVSLGPQVHFLSALLPISPVTFRRLPPPSWVENIQLLSLHFGPWATQDQQYLDKLLSLAADVAVEMPGLRIMELYNSGSMMKGNACHFRYKMEHDQPVLTLTTIRDAPFRPSPKVIAFWHHKLGSKMYRSNHPEARQLIFQTAFFNEFAEEIRMSGGHCIYKYLELKDLVLDPVTLAQLEAEVALGVQDGADGWVQ